MIIRVNENEFYNRNLLRINFITREEFLLVYKKNKHANFNYEENYIVYYKNTTK